jgi:hypothetical protein
MPVLGDRHLRIAIDAGIVAALLDRAVDRASDGFSVL